MTAVAVMNTGRRSGAPGREAGGIGMRDRSLEFRKAQRHTRRVQMLKRFLPAVACCVFFLYFVPTLFFKVSVNGGKAVVSFKNISTTAGETRGTSVTLKGANEKGVYEVTADSTSQNAATKNLTYLNVVHGKLTSVDGKVTTLTAPDGLYNEKTDELTFNNGARVHRAPSMTAIFQTAVFYSKQNLMISKTPVVVQSNDSTIHAQTMTLYTNEQRAIFEGKVHTHIERQSQSPSDGTGASQTKTGQAQGWNTGFARDGN